MKAMATSRPTTMPTMTRVLAVSNSPAGADSSTSGGPVRCIVLCVCLCQLIERASDEEKLFCG